MKLRSILQVSMGAALLAAGAAVGGAAGTNKTPEIALVEAAYDELTAGRSGDAIARYTEAIESRKLPVDFLANALLNRALAKQNVGRHESAIEDYTAAVRMDAMGASLRAVALYNRGLSHQKLGRAAKAIDDFTSALLLDPDLAQAYLSRANVLRQTGQYLFALGDYEKALRYSHSEPHLALYGQALTYEALDKPRLAQKALARAVKVSPDFEPARRKLLDLGGAKAVARAVSGDPPPAPQTQEESLAAQRDGFMTASLGASRPEMLDAKPNLPSAVEPTADLLGEGGAPGEGEPDTAEADAKTAPANAAKEPGREVIQPTAAVEVEVDQAEKAEPAAALEGWMVQLSSQRDEAAAWSAWEKLSKRYDELLAERDAAVVRADLGSKGIYYRLRVHRLDSRKEAEHLCSRLKSRGAACYYGRADS